MSNQDVKENQETNQSQSQEENTPLAQSAPEAPKPLFSGIDSQGKERLFKDAEEAQQSWQSAQNFIKTKVDETKSLEAKVQELEAQLNQSKKLEDALEHLQSKGESPVSEQQPQQTTETTPQLDVEQLKQQIRDEVMGSLSEAQKAEVYKTNQAESIEAAKAVFGESYEDKLRSAAQEMGMTDEDIIKEAQSNPKRFKKLFGLERQQPKNYVPNSSSVTRPSTESVQLNLGKGFSAKEKLSSHLSDLQAIAKKRGLQIDF